MGDGKTVIAEIDHKVEKLINLHIAEKAKSADLLTIVNKLEKTISEQKGKINELEEHLKLTNLAKSFANLDPKDKSSAKLRINELVKEIDKCLAQLNQ